MQDRDREIEEKTRKVEENDRERDYRQTRIEQLSHEISILKRQQFGRRSEQFTSEQMSLLEEAIDAELAAIELELKQLQPEISAEHSHQQPKRTSLPAQLPRTEIRHEPDSTLCHCGCERVRIGEAISEKLDYTPGVFTVERHIRGKWVCKNCETLDSGAGICFSSWRSRTQPANVPAQIDRRERQQEAWQCRGSILQSRTGAEAWKCEKEELAC